MTQTRTDEARRYRILDVVGEGGFGKVYRARLEGAARKIFSTCPPRPVNAPGHGSIPRT